MGIQSHSNLQDTTNQKLLEVALLCLEDGKARSVQWSKAPGELQDYLKKHYNPFYNFHFPAGSDDESDSDNEGAVQSKTSRKRQVLPESDSEKEFEDEQIESPHHQGARMLVLLLPCLEVPAVSQAPP